MAYIASESAFTTGSGVSVDTFSDGPDYTAGTSSQVTLSENPASENSVWIFFNGIAQHHSEYSINGKVVSFTSVIPSNVSTIEVQNNLQLAVGVPGQATVGYDTLTSNAITTLQRKNAIINGNFDFWQRGTSQTISQYGSDDRYMNLNGGTTKVASQQTFTLGQTDVPNNPRYYSRTVVTSVAGAGNFCLKLQRIEGVKTFAGETCTFSFWAKADANKNIAVDFFQYFGASGSPSPSIDSIGVTTFSLTTTWAKYTAVVEVPSISGKTLGTIGNDYLAPYFWFDAGATHDSRTNSLGQQSGTFDIAQVQLEKGNTATEFERRSIGEELALCQRYYINHLDANFHGATTSTVQGVEVLVSFPTTMRATPTMTKGTTASLINCIDANVSIAANDNKFFTLSCGAWSAANTCRIRSDDHEADAEL